jgi:type 1 fimbriae regulatory protein FimB
MNTKIKSSRKPAKKRERIKEFLTESEMEKFLKASKLTRNPERDYCLMLMAYRHGLRVSEAIDIRMSQLDLDGAYLYVRRLKGSRSGQQPIEGDELRTIRKWLHERAAYKDAGTDYLFLSEQGAAMKRQTINYLVKTIGEKSGFGFRVYPHMLRHSCGYTLANKNTATRTIQEALGHENIQNTVKYTASNPERLRGVWRRGK